MAKMKCPKCKGSNITLMANDTNMKSQTSLNLNPLNRLLFSITRRKKKPLPLKLD